jgi:hypothetical protein
MSGTEANLAVAALAIALVALFTAFGQLLQQYFATADGYRRCQKSVMGEYARKTRLRWRWREFRFETLYTIPEIFMAGDGAPSWIGQVVLTGSSKSRDSSLVPWGVGDGDALRRLAHRSTFATDIELESRRTQNVRYKLFFDFHQVLNIATLSPKSLVLPTVMAQGRRHFAQAFSCKSVELVDRGHYSVEVILR